MGLFKRDRPASDDDSLSPAEAVAAIGVCATYADGVISQEEDEDFAVHLGDMKLFRALGDRELRGMFQRIHGLSARLGDDGLLALAAEAVPADLRPTAFLVAADVLMGDDEFGEQEKGFLGELQKRLGLEDALARKILDVLEIKQRG